MWSFFNKVWNSLILIAFGAETNKESHTGYPVCGFY